MRYTLGFGQKSLQKLFKDCEPSPMMIEIVQRSGVQLCCSQQGQTRRARVQSHVVRSADATAALLACYTGPSLRHFLQRLATPVILLVSCLAGRALHKPMCLWQVIQVVALIFPNSLHVRRRTSQDPLTLRSLYIGMRSRPALYTPLSRIWNVLNPMEGNRIW